MADDLSPDHPAFRIVCRDLVELLTDYLEGSLSPSVRADVEAHLAVCAPCQAYLAHVQETVVHLGRIEATDELCAETRADVLAAFRDLMRPAD